MGKNSAIEWTEDTWNPWHGCHKVSQGCKNCYMFRDKARYGQDPNVVVRSKTKFHDPLKWPEPRKIFTCSWSDFFIEEADAWRDEAFAIMALTPQHTYQVLTKRPERMLEYVGTILDSNIDDCIRTLGHSFDYARIEVAQALTRFEDGRGILPNVWLGVSVEDQKTADERIPLLLQTPAAVRWLSMEPLLGPVDIHAWLPDEWSGGARQDAPYGDTPPIDWAVVGGESGPDARPMHPDWVRSIRDECTAVNVPFFFKQWGEWYPLASADEASQARYKHADMHEFDDGIRMVTIGKKAAGRLLDGRTWDEMPEVPR